MPEYDYIVSTGVIIPDTSTTLAEVQQEYRDAFNDQELVVDSGPLSVLINAEAESRDQVARNNARLANQINPNEAGGIFLDSIYALFNGERNEGERTTVTATLTGVDGTFIPEGSAAQSQQGDRFVSTGDANIGISGSVDVVFQSEDIGAIPLGAGELDKILDSVLGWENITNSTDGDLGQLTESDSDAQLRRDGLLGLQSVSQTTSIFARVLNVPDVQSLTFRENVADTTENVDGVIMDPHSVYVCVDGGTDSAVALALLDSKSAGAGWVGDITVPTIDPTSGQSYDVKLSRPEILDVQINVDIRPDSSLIDPVALTQEAVLAYSRGEIDTFPGFIVGANGEPFVINDSVNAYNESLNAVRVEMRIKNVGSFSADDLPILIFQQLTVIASDIAVNLV